MKRLERAARKIEAELKKLSYGNENDIIVREGEDGNSWEVIWECGPYEWSLNDGYGLFEELKGYGMPGDYEPQEFYSEIPGYDIQPINSYSVAVYKN